MSPPLITGTTLNWTAYPQVLSPLGGGAMAVATRTTESSSRVVVDEYVSDGKGGFRLSSMANDLLTYLHR